MYWAERIVTGKQYYLRVRDWLGHEIEEYDGMTTCQTRKEAEELMELIKKDHPSYHITVEEEEIAYTVHHF